MHMETRSALLVVATSVIRTDTQRASSSRYFSDTHLAPCLRVPWMLQLVQLALAQVRAAIAAAKRLYQSCLVACWRALHRWVQPREALCRLPAVT